jgi:hypothetical protein
MAGMDVPTLEEAVAALIAIKAGIIIAIVVGCVQAEPGAEGEPWSETKSMVETAMKAATVEPTAAEAASRRSSFRRKDAHRGRRQ